MPTVSIMSIAASIVSAWIPLPAFATSEMVENSWPMQNILAEVFHFLLFTAVWCTGCAVVVVTSCSREIFRSIVFIIGVWRKWLIVANNLIKLGLMKSSQTSWKIFVHYFAITEFYNRVWTQWTEWPYPLLSQLQNHALQLLRRIIGQDELSSARINSPTKISNNGKNVLDYEEFRELDKTAHDNLNLYLLPPVAKIAQEYETASTKIDLYTEDLEHYFFNSNRIQLRLFFDLTQNCYCIRIYDRGNPLLISVPTSNIAGTCSVAGHSSTCSCDYPWLKISKSTTAPTATVMVGTNGTIELSNPAEVAEIAGIGELQLIKNLIFLKYLWENCAHH